MELRVGHEIAGYRIDGVAGRGGMGVVYRATQLALDRTVALKVIAPQYAEDESFRSRFKRESRLAASIRHPNVITVYDAREEGGLLLIAMDYVDGTDLSTVIAERGRLPSAEAVRIVHDVAGALDAAHASGLVHRDVKPANVLVGRDGHVFLTDFGLTKNVASDSGITNTGAFLGTVDYMAPEQIAGERIDGQADVYALAAVLFHALTGHVPYPSRTHMAKLYAHTHLPPPSIVEFAPDVPRSLDAVVARGMAKGPAERYRSAGALGLAAFEAANGNVPVDAEPQRAPELAAPVEAAAPVPPPPPLQRAYPPPAAPPTAVPAATVRHGKPRPRFSPWLAVVAVLVLAAGAAALVLAGGGDDGGRGNATTGRASSAGSDQGTSGGSSGAAASSAAPLAGIPQKGVLLGNPRARVTVYEFADLQCPFCRESSQKTFPRLLDRYVRPGRVKILWRGLTFLGGDSVTAGRAALAAGAQNRLWDFVYLFFKEQGTENSGYVTQTFVDHLARSAGADPDKLRTDMNSPSVEQALGTAQNDASKFGVNSTPTFLIQVGTGKPRRLTLAGPDDISGFEAALDKALGGA
jgi:protein-disulfide isomerase